MREDFEYLRAEQKQRRQQRTIANVAVINASEFTFTHKVEENVFLCREAGFPSCDFYPASGRWKLNVSSKPPRWFNGGATSFLNWYRKQRKHGTDCTETVNAQANLAWDKGQTQT